MIRKIAALSFLTIFALPLSFSAKLKVPMANGETKDIGSTYIMEYSEGDYQDRGSSFSLTDANKDGYMDILEFDFENSGAYNYYYNIYIYNPQKGGFNEPKGFYNVVIEKDGTITDYFKGRAIEDIGSITKWKWNGENFIEVSNDDFFFYANAKYTEHTEYSAKGKESKPSSVKYYKEVSDKKIEIAEKAYNIVKNQYNKDSSYY